MLLFICGTDATFTVNEELSGLCSSKGAAAGEDLFLKVQETIVSLELNWENLKSVTADGRENVWF
jgi:hypothetical protein